MDVIVSDLVLLVAFGLLHLLSQQIGFAGVVKFYLVPYLWVNHWLMMVSLCALPHLVFEAADSVPRSPIYNTLIRLFLIIAVLSGISNAERSVLWIENG